MWQSGGIAFITVAHNTWSRCFLKYNLKICEVKSSYLYSKFNCWINCRIAWKEIISSTSRLKAENKIKPLLRNQKKLFEEYRKNGCFQVTNWVEQITWNYTTDLLFFRSIKGLPTHTSRHLTQGLIIITLQKSHSHLMYWRCSLKLYFWLSIIFSVSEFFIWKSNCCSALDWERVQSGENIKTEAKNDHLRNKYEN